MAADLQDKPAERLSGGVFMSLAMASFIVNDTFTKLLAQEVRLGEFIFVRGLFAIAVLAAAVVALGRLHAVALIVHPGVLLRAAMDLTVTFLFVNALFHMPLPNITAIMQAAPLTVTLLAALFLNEPVGWRRISAILVGFAGVLLVVRPGHEGFNVYVLSALAALLAGSVRDVATRRIPASVPSVIIALANALIVTAGGFMLNAYQGFRPLPLGTIGVLAVTAAFLVGGYFSMVLALRAQELALTAPFRYTIIVWSVLAGWLVFGDVPDIVAFAGIALIVGSGLFTVYREAQLARRARHAP